MQASAGHTLMVHPTLLSFLSPLSLFPPLPPPAPPCAGFMGVSAALVFASECAPSLCRALEAGAWPQRCASGFCPLLFLLCSCKGAGSCKQRAQPEACHSFLLPAAASPLPCAHFLSLLFSPPLLLLLLPDLGAAYGTAKAGVGIASMGIMHPSEAMKNIVPVIMAGILGIYGLIVAAILVGKSECQKAGALLTAAGMPCGRAA